ncbi:MAG TPA: hypothetical protein VE992_07685 [Solirubrobacteraceae bacterium]|nr:hypothetical protein [Solirubrobacteraceae bacterium]
MPENSPPPSEHSLIQEITAPLATLPDDPVPVVADVDFPLVLRGYDRDAVDAYVRKTSQLVAELTATRSPEAAVRRALQRVGEEVSGILQRAHETAEQITAKSRTDAEDRLELARQEAARITATAEDRVKDLDAETDRIWAERQRIVEDAQELARQLLSLAESAAARFPAEEAPHTSLASPPPPPAPAPVDEEPPPLAGDGPLAGDEPLTGDELLAGDEPLAEDEPVAEVFSVPPGREFGVAPPEEDPSTQETRVLRVEGEEWPPERGEDGESTEPHRP